MKSTSDVDQRPPSARERILRAAAAVAVERGLRGATVQDILSAAPVSRRTFYQHYPSIEGVACDLYIEKLAALLEQVSAAAMLHDDPSLRLQSSLDAYVDSLHEGGRLLMLLQGEAMRPDSMLAPVRAQAHEDLVAALCAQVESSTGGRPSALLLRCLLMGVEGVMGHLQRDGELSPQAIAAVRSMVLDVIASGAAR